MDLHCCGPHLKLLLPDFQQCLSNTDGTSAWHWTTCCALPWNPYLANTAIFCQLGDPKLRSCWRGRWNSIQTSCCDKTVSRGLLHLRYKKQKAFCQPCQRWMLPHLKALCIGGERHVLKYARFTHFHFKTITVNALSNIKGIKTTNGSG